MTTALERNMQPCRTLVILAAAAVVATAEPALSLTLPDAGGTAAALTAGIGRGVADAPAWSAWRELLAARGGLAWRWMPGAGAVRMTVEVGSPVAGLDSMSFAIGAMVPEGRDPVGVPGLAVQRIGAWLHAGTPMIDASLPERTPVERPFQRVDLAMRVDLAALDVLASAWTRVPRAAGASAVSVVAGIVADAIEESIDIAGGLPLKAVDQAALAGLPADAGLVFACGIDGAALVGRFAAVRAALSDGEGRRLDQLLGGDPAAVVAALDGTVVFALPAPGAGIVSLPAAPALDGILDGLIRLEHLDAGDQEVAQARAQGTSLQAVSPWPCHLRRTAGRWLLASDPRLLAGLADPEALAFPVERFGGGAEGACVLAAWDGGVLARLAASACAGSTDPLLRGGGDMLAGIASALPAGWLRAHASPDGLTIQARNGPGAAICAGLMVGDVLIPALAAQRHQAVQAASRRAMERFAIQGRRYADAHDDRWPRDLGDLKAWSKEALDGVDALVPGLPGHQPAYCYVRPATTVDQPILVQDPAVSGGAGSLVAFPDGRVQFMPGQAVWQEAQRLHQATEAGKRGAGRDEWTVMPRVF